MNKRLKQIQSNIDRLEAQKARLIRDKAIPDIIAQMRRAGITPQEIAEAWGPLTARRTRRGARAGAPKPEKPRREPKYRDPATGSTWSGMGKRPAWLREAEDAGRSRDDFLIPQSLPQ